jgi:3-oxoacyl-[acyl-carrier protein] reductase
MKSLQGKVALVTGAGRGLGRAIAAALAEDGCDVVGVVARPGDQAWLADLADRTGQGVAGCVADLRSPGGAVAAVAAATQAFGRLDILVNHAGVGRQGDFFALTDQEWEAAFRLKVLGAVRLTREAWPLLVQAKGALVNVTGPSALRPRPGHEICASLSAGLVALTKSLAARGMKDGVRVNAVSPGLVLEGDGVSEALRRAGPPDELARDRLIGALAVAALGLPEDVARVVAFLVSERAAYVQGALINVDGGRTREL